MEHKSDQNIYRTSYNGYNFKLVPTPQRDDEDTWELYIKDKLTDEFVRLGSTVSKREGLFLINYLPYIIKPIKEMES